MDLYRRIARIRTEDDADDMTDELIDRFGDPPRTVNNLISVALLRGRAAACGISDITQKGQVLTLTLDEFDLEQVSRLAGAFPGQLLFSPGDKAALTFRLRRGDDPLRAATRLVDDYTRIQAPPAGEN